MDIPKLRINLFGGLELRVGGVSKHLEKLDRYMLLAFVACRGGEAGRELTVKTLWENRPDRYQVDNPDATMRVVLQDLRTDLMKYAPPRITEKEARFLYLPQKPTFIVLSPDHCSSDVGDFLQELRSVRASQSDEDRLAVLERAIDIYKANEFRGALLEGYSWDWVEKEGKSLERKYQLAVEEWEKLSKQLGVTQRTIPPSPPVDAQLQDPDTTRAPVEPDGKAARVVLLYKRNAPFAQHLLELLESRLATLGCQVFIDRQIRLGAEWEQEMRRQVRSADAVIPLLSAESIWSERLEEEIRIAHDAAQQQAGKPRILPVRVRFKDPLPEPLGAVLDRLQYTLWQGPHDDERIVTEILEALRKPVVRFEPASGPVPLDSPFYLLRPADQEFTSAVMHQDGIVLVKGARQMGKTSLLARGLQRARAAGMQTAVTDLQALDEDCFASVERFYLALATAIVDQLDLNISPQQVWDSSLGANDNMKRFIRRQVLGTFPEPFLWGLDEVDRLFTCSFGNGVFGMFRSWYSLRQLDPTGPWQRLTLAIAYATEASLFITDLNQSPFNVGTRLPLEDFTFEQVEELNRRYDRPLKSEGEIRAFYELLGGQPYLTRRGLHEMATQGIAYAAFAAEADDDEGVFGDHLHRILLSIQRDLAMKEVVCGLLRGQPCPTQESFYRLRTAGIVVGTARHKVQLRCQLYRSYLTGQLLGVTHDET